jgi:hypothetical protein
MRGWRDVGVAAVVGFAALSLVFASSAATRGLNSPPRCRVVQGIMTVDPGYWEITIRREGDRIVPSYARGDVECDHATVNSVDLLRILGPEFHLDLRQGALAPGATPESDGSSEIEVEADVGLGGFFFIQLGDESDHVTLGRVGHELGINLNADESVADVDMRIASTERKWAPEPRISLGDGDDLLDATGREGFAGPLDAEHDLFEFHGGSGRDRILGGPSKDILYGGGGADLLSGGSDTDYVQAARGGSDRIDCGPGGDYLSLDPTDGQRNCEHRFPKG